MTPQDRFWTHVDKSGECWEWTAATNRGGYGFFRLYLNGPSALSHRWSYFWTKGEIPDGYQIDHLCKNRRCVRPDHLEAVTPWENNRRSESPTAIVIRRNTCPQAHPLETLERPWFGGRKRVCRECLRARRKDYYWTKQKPRKTPTPDPTAPQAQESF